MRNEMQFLNEHELECLAALWSAKEPLQSSQVHLAIIDKRREIDSSAKVPAYTTVATWLQKMAKKGILEVTTTDGSPVQACSPHTAYKASSPENTLGKVLKLIAVSCPHDAREKILAIFSQELGVASRDAQHHN